MSALLDRLYHLHWITPEAARSAQPYLGFYPAFLKSHGFRGLINLRGENPGFSWWRNEVAAAEALGIKRFDVRLSSRNLPTRKTLAALMTALETAPRPLLIKCSGGQDRTGLAAALYLLNLKGEGALPEAEEQFSLWPYLHRPKSGQRWLKAFPAYAIREAGDLSLGRWAREVYRPEEFARWLDDRGLSGSFKGFQVDAKTDG